MSADFVSIVTCTYNRVQFYENLKKLVAYQDYPHDRLEWIIADDSPISYPDKFPVYLDGISVRYFHLKQKIPLGKKRDFVNMLAKGKYIVNMDDDDFYPPCRVSHAVENLIKSGYPLAGSTTMFMYFCKDRKIYQFGPYNTSHATAATFAYTKAYADTHTFFDPSNGNYAEESTFTENGKTPMIQLDPMKVVLAVSHTDNTIEKTMFLEAKYGQIGRTIALTGFQLSDFIKPDDIYNFYLTMPYEYKVNDISKEVRTILDNNAASLPLSKEQQMFNRMAADIKTLTEWQARKTLLKLKLKLK